MTKMSKKLSTLFNYLRSGLEISSDILEELQDITDASKILKGEQEILENISEMIKKARSSLIIVLPEIISEILELIAENAYQRKAARFILTTSIDVETYGNAIRKMQALGNIQFRHVAEPLRIYACTRDAIEFILGISGDQDDEMIGILSDKAKIYSKIAPFILQRSQLYKFMRVKKKKKEKKKKKKKKG